MHPRHVKPETMIRERQVPDRFLDRDDGAKAAQPFKVKAAERGPAADENEWPYFVTVPAMPPDMALAAIDAGVSAGPVDALA